MVVLHQPTLPKTKRAMGQGKTSTPLVRELDVEPTPRSEAKAANKLPKAEQLEHFEEALEAKDSGNQPA